MRPCSAASTVVLSSNRGQYAMPAMHRYARSTCTCELTGTALGIAQLSLLENVQEAAKKSLHFTVAALMCSLLEPF